MRSIVIDVCGLIGLVMLGCGLWLISPIWMLTVIGALLLLLALTASYFSSRVPKKADKRGG